MKNCGKRFHLLITSKDFVQDLVKLIGPKNDPPAALQEKVSSVAMLIGRLTGRLFPAAGVESYPNMGGGFSRPERLPRRVSSVFRAEEQRHRVSGDRPGRDGADSHAAAKCAPVDRYTGEPSAACAVKQPRTRAESTTHDAERPDQA